MSASSSDGSDSEHDYVSQLVNTQTGFDNYFVHTASKAKTSQNVFEPLSAEEYAESIQPVLLRTRLRTSCTDKCSPELDGMFLRCRREMEEGFNLLFYGFGSKRVTLNQFAMQYCSSAGHVVVANAFQPRFTVKSLLDSIESNVPGIPAGSEPFPRRIAAYFTDPHGSSIHLYLIIHNIDSDALRKAQAKSIILMLASAPRVHIAASVDHLNAALLFSSSELTARPDGDGSGFAWLWHDLTTLAPYDAELAHADRSSVSGAHIKSAALQAETPGAPSVATESAARHVLASVTDRAKRLFKLMAEKQLEVMGDDVAATEEHGVSYTILFAAAQGDLIVTNDVALRACLGEFKDHGFIVGTDVLWIPLKKDRLAKVLAHLQTIS